MPLDEERIAAAMLAFTKLTKEMQSGLADMSQRLIGLQAETHLQAAAIRVLLHELKDRPRLRPELQASAEHFMVNCAAMAYTDAQLDELQAIIDDWKAILRVGAAPS